MLLRCRRVWVDEAIVSGTIVYGTLSDMSSGSRREGFDRIFEISIGFFRTFLDKERYPAFVILLLALPAWDQYMQNDIGCMQYDLIGCRQKMGAWWNGQGALMAARNLCISVVVVAAAVVFAMERNAAEVVVMLSRAMPCVETSRSCPAVMVMGKQ